VLKRTVATSLVTGAEIEIYEIEQPALEPVAGVAIATPGRGEIAATHQRVMRRVLLGRHVRDDAHPAP
jgi:hypothetical protein